MVTGTVNNKLTRLSVTFSERSFKFRFVLIFVHPIQLHRHSCLLSASTLSYCTFFFAYEMSTPNVSSTCYLHPSQYLLGITVLKQLSVRHDFDRDHRNSGILESHHYITATLWPSQVAAHFFF